MKITIEFEIDEKKLVDKVKGVEGREAVLQKLRSLAAGVNLAVSQAEIHLAPDVPEGYEYCPAHGMHKKDAPPSVCPEHGTIYQEHEGCPLCVNLVRTEAAP